jgi:pantoate--beta-alanine ligase
MDKTIGFVPTMGNLHAGHLSLLERSVRENEICVLSIFVNPTQFEQKEDLIRYPRTLESDLEKARNLNVHYVIIPSQEDLYPDDYTYRVVESHLSKILCGKSRTGHFEGVLTVVLKLLLLVQPDRCYFGEKDYQQLHLIKGMLTAFFLEIELVACPTIRDEDGLALSSRNQRLTAEERNLAANFPRILKTDLPIERVKESLREAGFAVEYVEEELGRRFGAVLLGDTRLIDNFPISELGRSY